MKRSLSYVTRPSGVVQGRRGAMEQRQGRLVARIPLTASAVTLPVSSRRLLAPAYWTRAFGTSTSSSPPLSPFETDTAVTTPSTAITGTPQRGTKSPDQIWIQMSNSILQQPTTSIPASLITDMDMKHVQECIRWWIRQSPTTPQTLDYVWKLWERYQAALVQTNRPMDMDLFAGIVDHWRIAILQGDIENMVTTPYNVAHVITQVRQQPGSNIKLYGMILDAMSHLRRPQEAEDLVALMQQEGILRQDDLEDVPSTLIIWNSVLTAWARSSRPDAGTRAVAVWKRMKHKDAYSYAIVLEAIAKQLETAQSSSTEYHQKAIQLVEEVFSKAEKEQQLSEMAWLQRLRAWGVVDKHKARELLYSLRQQYLSTSAAAAAGGGVGNTTNSGTTIAPNQYIFTTVMSAFAKVGDLDVVRQLWSELSSLHDHFEPTSGGGGDILTTGTEPDSPFLPSSQTLTAVLQSFGKSKDPERAQKAQALLEVFMEHPSTRRIVDRGVVNCVVDAWAGFGDPKNVEAIRDLMAFMRQSGSKAMYPDAYTFNAMLKALSRSNGREALKTSRMFLKEMWALCRQPGNKVVKPTAVSYNTILYAYSRLAPARAVHEAEALFEELWGAYNAEKDPKLLPTEATYVSMITTWIRSKRKEAPSRAAFYFDHMRAKYASTKDVHLQPTVRVYNALIDSHRLYRDVVGAERTLHLMMEDYKNGNVKAQPTTSIFNTVLNVFLKSQDRHAPPKMEKLLLDMIRLADTEGWPCRPSTRTYNTVIDSWASLRSTNSAYRAEAVFRHLQKRYVATGDQDLRPDCHSFTAYMNAWAKSGSPDAPEKVAEIFQEMTNNYDQGERDLGPGSVAYVLLLSTCSRSTRPDAPARALAILNEMIDGHSMDPDRYPKPRPEHFGAVMNAFAERGDVENAEAILDRMLLGRDEVHPNRSCWNGILKACLKSNVEDAPERATAILDRMKKHAQLGFRESRPDAVVYTTLLEIWRASKRHDSYQEGVRLLDEILADCEVDTNNHGKLDPGVFLSLLRNLKESPLPNKIEHLDGLVNLMRQHRIQQSWPIRSIVTDLENEKRSTVDT